MVRLKRPRARWLRARVLPSDDQPSEVRRTSVLKLGSCSSLTSRLGNLRPDLFTPVLRAARQRNEPGRDEQGPRRCRYIPCPGGLRRVTLSWVPVPTSTHPPSLDRKQLADQHDSALPSGDAARALLPGPSNRLILSLLSGVESDVDWALRDLLKYSAHNTERLTLSVWVHAVDALLTWPHRLIGLAQDHGRWGEAGWELRGEAGEATQRRASESLIILRNAGFNEKANGKLLGSSSRLADFLEAFFALESDLLLDHLAEQALLVLDILDALLASSTFKLRSDSIIPMALIPLFRSRDRAMLLAASRITLSLTSPSYSRLPALPASHPLVAPALETAIHLLLLPKSPAERHLRTVALDLIYQHTTDAAGAVRHVLHRPDVGPIVRLLAQGLYDDSSRSVQPVYLHPRDRIGIIDVRFRPLLTAPVDPDEWLPSPQELDLLTMMPEPDRCTRWCDLCESAIALIHPTLTLTCAHAGSRAPSNATRSARSPRRPSGRPTALPSPIELPSSAVLHS